MKVEIKHTENNARACTFTLKTGKVLKTPTYFPRLSWDRKMELFNDFYNRKSKLLSNIEGINVPSICAQHVFGKKQADGSVNIEHPVFLQNKILMMDPSGKHFFHSKEVNKTSRKWLVENRYISEELNELLSTLENLSGGRGSSEERDITVQEISIELSKHYERFLRLQLLFKPDVLFSLDIPMTWGLRNIPIKDSNGNEKLVTRIDLAFDTIRNCMSVAKIRYPEIDFLPFLSVYNNILKSETRKIYGTQKTVWEHIFDSIKELKDIDGLAIKFIDCNQNIEDVMRFISKIREVIGDKLLIVFGLDEPSYGLMLNGLDGFSCEMCVKPGKGRGKKGQIPEAEGSWYHPQNKKLYLRRELFELVDKYNLDNIPCSYPFCSNISLDVIRNYSSGLGVRNKQWWEYTKFHYLESKNMELGYLRDALKDPEKSFKVALLSHILNNPHDGRKDLLTLLKIIGN